MKSIRSFLLAAIAVMVVALFAPAIAAAADATDAAMTAPTPWYLSTEAFAALFSLVAGTVAVWQNKQKTTAEKVSASLVVAIEAASKIPQVAEHEKAIKAKLNEKLTKSGAQPVVERLLRGLT